MTLTYLSNDLSITEEPKTKHYFLKLKNRYINRNSREIRIEKPKINQ